MIYEYYGQKWYDNSSQLVDLLRLTDWKSLKKSLEIAETLGIRNIDLS